MVLKSINMAGATPAVKASKVGKRRQFLKARANPKPSSDEQFAFCRTLRAAGVAFYFLLYLSISFCAFASGGAALAESPGVVRVAANVESKAPKRSPAPEEESGDRAKKYWEYYHKLAKASEVSVAIAAADAKHVVQTLQEVKKLSRRGVIINRVVLVGAGPAAFNDGRSASAGAAPSPATAAQIAALTDLGLSQSRVELGAGILPGAEASYSPLWVITYRGRRYIYEGLRSPARLFTEGGVFREAKD